MAGLTQKLRQDYFLLYESCLVRPARKAAVDQVARRLGASRPRYEKVAKALRMPWYVVAVIHSLEAGGDFTRHLHNGDPLGARTTHLPAGRPKTGAPPFTWEASAIDALTYRGFGKWTDWSIPGTLYKLEGYNGWGYRDHHPKVHSPYLWSFSNHYTRGKYVADGRFSPTAISQQCGAAVLLRRLQAGGKAAVQAGPRVLQLANPHMTGPDIEELQRLLAKNVRLVRRRQAGRRVRRADRRRSRASEVGARLSPERGQQRLRPAGENDPGGEEAATGPVQAAADETPRAGPLRAGDPQTDRQLGALGLQEQRPDRLLAERLRPPERT